MRNEAKAANGGALSVDQAVARLGESPKKKNVDEAEEAAPAEVTLRQAQGEEGEDALRQAQGEEAPDGDDAEEADDAEDAELEPPKFWDAKSKERFAELPRDLQQIVLAKENERNQATARALQESAERRKTAEAEAARFKSAADNLARISGEAENNFQNRWSNLDWRKAIEQHGAEGALKPQLEMQAEQRGLQLLSAAKELTDRLSHARFVQEQEALIPEFAPDLVGHDEGKARREELGRFLLGLGVPTARIPHLSALEAGLAYDAMQWRNGKAKAGALLKAPQQSASPKRMPVKPVGSAARGSAHHNRITHLSNKRELTIDEAVELHNLKGQS